MTAAAAAAAAAALGVRSCLLVTTTLAAINIGPVAVEDIVIARAGDKIGQDLSVLWGESSCEGKDGDRKKGQVV